MIDSVIARMQENVVDIARLADERACKVVAVFPGGHYNGRGEWTIDGTYVMLISGTLQNRYGLGEELAKPHRAGWVKSSLVPK